MRCSARCGCCSRFVGCLANGLHRPRTARETGADFLIRLSGSDIRTRSLATWTVGAFSGGFRRPVFWPMRPLFHLRHGGSGRAGLFETQNALLHETERDQTSPCLRRPASGSIVSRTIGLSGRMFYRTVWRVGAWLWYLRSFTGGNSGPLSRNGERLIATCDVTALRSDDALH